MFAASAFSTVPFASGPGFLYSVNVSENATAAEQASASAVMNAQASEQARAADTIFSNFTVNGAVSESARGAETVQAQVAFAVQVNEAARTAETASSLGIFNATAAEAVRPVDAPSAGAIFISNLLESAQAYDAFISRLLWDTINTSDAAVWSVIPSAQVTILPTVGGGFSNGSFASGAFNALGAESEIGTDPLAWRNVNTFETTDWEVVKTQT